MLDGNATRLRPNVEENSQVDDRSAGSGDVGADTQPGAPVRAVAVGNWNEIALAKWGWLPEHYTEAKKGGKVQGEGDAPSEEQKSDEFPAMNAKEQFWLNSMILVFAKNRIDSQDMCFDTFFKYLFYLIV